MNLLRHVVLIQFATTLAFGQPAPPNQPEAVVQGLYRQVIARHPIGIPDGADMKAFAPYLSKVLLRRMDVAVACAADYHRRYPDPNSKPPFAWLEAGLFSGANEQAEPRAYLVEKTQSENDGSYRVYVSLTLGTPPEKPWNWQIAAIVMREGDALVVDDVIYLKDESREVDGRLSEYLSAGCDGAHWVGRH